MRIFDEILKLLSTLLFIKIDKCNADSITIFLGNQGGGCKTCVNEFRCFNRLFKSVMVKERCLPAACEFWCATFTYDANHCPICYCNEEYSTREPCDSIADCYRNAIKCERNLCYYKTTARLMYPEKFNQFDNLSNRTRFPTFPRLPLFPQP